MEIDDKVREIKSITDPSVVFTFALNKKTFELIWHHVFVKDKTPYAYDERDRLWDLMCCEHQDEKIKEEKLNVIAEYFKKHNKALNKTYRVDEEKLRVMIINNAIWWKENWTIEPKALAHELATRINKGEVG